MSDQQMWEMIRESLGRIESKVDEQGRWHAAIDSRLSVAESNLESIIAGRKAASEHGWGMIYAIAATAITSISAAALSIWHTVNR